MVFFSCDACGESLKKNQVEKHSYRCKTYSLSCLDCQLMFTTRSYATHTKCITENQKYGGQGYVEKEAKGELKQNAWITQVESAIENVSDLSLKNLLKNILGFTNIPRKEAKFINFLTNSCRINNRGLCTRAWQAIAVEAEKLKKIEESQKAEEEKKKAEAAESEAKTKADAEKAESSTKKKAQEDSKEDDASKFKWKSAIKRKLKEAGGEMKVKKLRSAVLEDYRNVYGEIEDDSVFDEKLKKAGVSIDGKKAILA
ncbi:unnamed protein product [Auanema sp. JU1783]|nr:unnamed protein product [Auanema sp. JU1783]